MPLVTQLREGVHPLIFPTDLSVSTLEKNTTTSSSAGSSIIGRKSPPPIFSSPNGSNAGGAAALVSSVLCGGDSQDGTTSSSINKSVAGLAGNLCGLGLLSNAGGGLGVLSSSNGSGHPCPDCGRVYKLKSSLRNHQKWECGKEPQFQCPFCVYRAKQKMHIGRHMERMHKEKFIKLEDVKMYTEDATNMNHSF